ncbi:MAG: PilZ domain-containing protein [Candidatus Omnitrophica bacterium]|nr:PilZ domain-containing protein [Candidatus Omnitrophota bacterium]
MKEKPAERRLHPRIDHALPIKIAANGYNFSTSTENVSCVGAYCHLDKYIPPFTRIAVKVVLPVTSAGKKRNIDVECKGVIVRSIDENKGGYNVAVFFNGIQENQRKKIAEYISQFLPKNSL